MEPASKADERDVPRPAAQPAHLVILIPSFNDWAALELLLGQLDRVELPQGWQASAVIVDDASTQPLPQGWPGVSGRGLASVEILHLRSNLGHQRAIAIGLYHIHELRSADAVAVMDADGEDRAEDLPALIAAFEAGARREAVFAARTRRMESFSFQFFYQAYRLLHRLLTGIEVRVGNFSVLPREAITRLMAVPDLWNHYAAAVFRARLPRRLVPLARGRRLTGESKMNFVSLLTHGVNAISVFSDTVSARLLAMTGVFGSALALAVAATLARGWILGAALPSWFALAAGLLGLLLVQCVFFALVFVFTIANRRSATSFILQRDATYFILGRTSIVEPRSLNNLNSALAAWSGSKLSHPGVEA